MTKKIVSMILSLLLTASALVGCASPKYLGKNPELYTVAIYNFFGSVGYGSNGEVPSPAETGIIETDSYGRVLFYYHEGIISEGCGYGIIQKAEDGYAYYYEDDCVLCAGDDGTSRGKVTHDEWFTEDELSAFKALNDWEQEFNEETCTKRTIVSQKPEEKLKLRDKDFEKATKDWLTNNGFQIKNNKQIYSTIEFFMADDYGREIYCIYVNEYRLTGVIAGPIVLAVMFMPDGTCDPTVSVVRIDDMKNYRDQMKAFRQNNGWNTAYEQK